MYFNWRLGGGFKSIAFAIAFFPVYKVIRIVFTQCTFTLIYCQCFLPSMYIGLETTAFWQGSSLLLHRGLSMCKLLVSPLYASSQLGNSPFKDTDPPIETWSKRSPKSRWEDNFWRYTKLSMRDIFGESIGIRDIVSLLIALKRFIAHRFGKAYITKALGTFSKNDIALVYIH